MKQRFAKFFLAATLFFSAQNSFASTSRNLTIFAEPNIALALTKIARAYSQTSNVIVSVNFSSSSNLINNIDSGEPADIFISAHQGWIDALHQKGLVDIYNVGYIARDELVLATLKSNPNLPAEFADKKISLEDALKILNKNKSTLILDDEGNSSGSFAKDLVDRLSLEDLKLFSKLAEDKTPFLSIVRNNGENYSLLLESQIKNRADFQTIATKTDKNIFYQALVIAGDNMETAREFVKFLKSESAKTIFKESGFITN